MKRFFNFRPLLLVFLTTIGAVYSVIKAFLGSFVPLVIFGIFVLLNLVIFIISLFKTDVLQGFFKVFGAKSAKICCLIVLITAVMFSSIASISFVINVSRDFENGKYNVTASVKEVVTTENETKLLLGNIKINGKNYGFNIQANVEGSFETGDILNFNAYLSKSKLVSNGKINTNILKNKVHYYCSINEDSLTKQSGKAGFIDLLKSRTKLILNENMTEQNAGFGYAVLFGDKSLLTENYYDIFRNGGLAHILAVSGMHIAFLVGAILFILKLCKVKKKVQFLVVLGVLFIYNFLCNFSPSVFRASVMSLCLMLGMILGERNDSISNISLAGIIILLFQPMYLFDVGFLLSFGAVFGIFMFAKTFEKLFVKIKMPKFLASSISIICGATLGTLPWICKFFKVVAPISFISNLIVVPLFSIMYITLLISVVISLVFALPIMLSISQFFINIVVGWSAIFAKFGVISTVNFDTFCACFYYIICFIASPYFIMKNRPKLICTLSFVVALTGCLANCNYTKNINKNAVFVTENTSKTLIFTTRNGKTILSNVSKDKNFDYQLDSFLTQSNLSFIDYVIVYNYDVSLCENVSSVVNNYKVKSLYLFGDYDSGTLLGLTNNLYSANPLNVVNSQILQLDDSIKIECYSDSSKTKAVCFDICGEKSLQILSSITPSEIMSVNLLKQDFKMIYAEKFYERYLDIFANSYICVNFYGNNSNVCVLQNDEYYEYTF